jgi:hypothetical protein
VDQGGGTSRARVVRAPEAIQQGPDGAHADEELGGDAAVGLAGGYELPWTPPVPFVKIRIDSVRAIQPLQLRCREQELARRDGGEKGYVASDAEHGQRDGR